MKYLLLILIMISVSVMADYKKRLEVVDLPFSEATMLENNINYKDVVIHAKKITEDEEESFFNETLLSDGFVPIFVSVTNNSREKVTVYGSQTNIGDSKNLNVQLLLDKYQVGHLAGLKTAVVIMSFGMQSVMGGGAHEAENQGYDEAKKNNFNDKSLHTKLLYPGDTISGIVYFSEEAFDKSNKLEIPLQVMNSISKEIVEVNIN